MKGSAITGPVGKEAAELWPVRRTSVPTLNSLLIFSSVLPATLVSSCKVSFFRGSWLELLSCMSHIASTNQWAQFDITHAFEILLDSGLLL